MIDHEVNQSAESSNRIAYYRRGYGDGAKGSAHRHPDNKDYGLGYTHGSFDSAKAVGEFCEKNGLSLPSALR